MGPVLCLVSAACFGAMPIFGKFAYAAGVSPSALLLVRFALAAALLAALALLRPGLRRGPAGPPASRRRGLLLALGLGMVGYAAQASLYFSALRHMDASLLALILYTYPILVTGAAVLMGRDRLTPGRTVALVTASGGTLLVLLGAGGLSASPIGAVLAFGSAVVYSAYILVADRVVHQLPPVVLSTVVMAGAAGSLAVAALITGGVHLDFPLRGWFWLGAIAVVSTVLAMLAFFAGLRRTGPSTTAIVSTFEPVVTTVLATLLLGESLSPTQLTGGLLVLASVAVLQVRRPRARVGPAARPAARVSAEARAAARVSATVPPVAADGSVDSGRSVAGPVRPT